MPTDVEQAEHVLNNLRQKREVFVVRDRSLDEEITQLAFAAHTGDKAARQKLDKLNAEKALNDSEHRSIDAAISEATVRVQKAQEAESQALAGEAARELLKKADALLVHAQSLDDANAVRVEASHAIIEELNQMRELARGLGVFVPSHEQFLSLGSRAEQTATMQTPFAREIGEHLPPRERRSHLSYAGPWRDAVAKGCAAILGEQEREVA
jgi:hypothetical protein